MPRVSTIQTNFTAGEISPRVRGRVDISRYQNGAELIENAICDIYGGVVRAPGSMFIGAAISNDRRSLLVPFTSSRSASYHLEWSGGKMRVIRAGAGIVLKNGVPYEVSFPFSDAELDALTWAKAGDTMFIAHPDHPIHTLRRLADDNWQIAPAPFSVLPFGETGHAFGASLTLSAASVGTGRSATASFPVFLESDVGRRITYLSGVAVVTSVPTTSTVNIEITSPFTGTVLPASEWTLDDSPQATLTPSAKGTIGQSITLTLNLDGWRASTDVGRWVEVNRGLVQITAVTSARIASGVVKADLDSNVAAQAGAWKLQASVWSQANGYPSAVGIYQQRLVAGGSKRYPNGVWGSRSALYLDFTQGSQDTDGYFYRLDGESNGVGHLASVRVLMALTPGTEWTLSGGVEKGLTPTNVQAKDQSVYGCGPVKPVRIGDELIFVQRSGRKVRAMGYRVENDAYAAPNLTTLAEHITKSGVVQMAYQQEPDSVLWCILANGRMAGLTIDRDEGVTAWHSHVTDGFYESISAAPAGEYDDLVAVVRRTINGQQVRYLERFSTESLVHCGIVGTSIEPKTVWGGLSHLEGKEVAILADGVPQAKQTVASGNVTLARGAKDVQIGIPVVPRVRLLRPEIQTQTGTAQSNQMRTHKFSLLVLNTGAAVINDRPVAFRQFGSDLLDKPPPEYSGWKSVGEWGWSDGSLPVEIRQDDPLPFHILAVVRHWTSNE
ncbi:hypothetical protein RVU96_16785 [Bordetella avium]|uniref:hypothetical protein n=1 Tax=Bordetella avium TaxID=521 RepID=UPI000E0B0828|nr:hypothetical protein [Bordetella avium]RIQ11570.1 hypothetical protein D0432_16305 [Bordetella avium]RIQ44931.1 hypothetical protein D0845_17135 [Bordetella avium]RIQ49581.1 hypothetical protein D0844_16430 [Bordetella avium]RIQ55322.1 hypothetical protein D0841_16520 [Bordetella avium]RIQ58426.1 hypothetical protein D0842_16525 [Bordetella avium]